jgi:hypothetical protein
MAFGFAPFFIVVSELHFIDIFHGLLHRQSKMNKTSIVAIFLVFLKKRSPKKFIKSNIRNLVQKQTTFNSFS